MENIRFLLDTNIGIQLEEINKKSGEIAPKFKKLAKLCHKHGIKLFHHPDSFVDLDNDKDSERKKATKSKLQKYPRLKQVPHGETSELEDLFTGISSPNDLIDCQILYSLKRDCIEYLISEDNGIHKRANYSGLNERVFTADEANNFISKFFQKDPFIYPQTKQSTLDQLNVNDPIFDSLKNDYKNFCNWFLEMQNQKATCWTIRNNKKIAAICIVEKKREGKLSYRPGKKTLKACTFKVSDEFQGRKYGELLLKNLFYYCTYHDYDLVYMTAFSKHENLAYFLKDFGFQLGPIPRENKELEYFKTFYPAAGNHPRVEPLDFYKKWFPYFYDDKSIQKYIIPIKPKYHDILFPEIRPTPPLFEDTDRSIPGNTIKKVYLSHSPTKKLDPGSLILFYRSRPQQNLTTIAIVEKTERFNELPSLLKEISKRSVYNIDEIEDMLKKEVLMIKFRLIQHLKNPLSAAKLKELGVFRRPPMSILNIRHKSYLKLNINPGETA